MNCNYTTLRHCHNFQLFNDKQTYHAHIKVFRCKEKDSSNKPVKSSSKQSLNRWGNELGCCHDVFLSQGFSMNSIQEVRGTGELRGGGGVTQRTDGARQSWVCVVNIFLQISLHLVKFVIFNGFNDHIGAGVFLKELAELDLINEIIINAVIKYHSHWKGCICLHHQCPEEQRWASERPSSSSLCHR